MHSGHTALCIIGVVISLCVHTLFLFVPPSTGLSELDLPDMTTTVNLSNTVKGLSRKRPHRSLNITAFNRQLEHEGKVRVGTVQSVRMVKFV